MPLIFWQKMMSSIWMTKALHEIFYNYGIIADNTKGYYKAAIVCYLPDLSLVRIQEVQVGRPHFSVS